MLLEALHISIPTPFHPDGRLNLHKLASNIARYSKTPAAGLILLAPSAEPTLLADDETHAVLSTAAQSAAPEKVLIAGISRDSVPSSLALADFAATLHYDAILISIPSIPTTPLELLTYFQTVADRSPLPLILLSTATHPLTLDIIANLASHPNILGLLTTEPTPNIADILTHTSTIRREVTVTPTFLPVTHRMLQASAHRPTSTLISAASLTSTATAVAEPPPIAPVLRTRTKSVGFQIIAGHTPTLLASLNAGAISIAPAFAACAPQAAYEVFAAWKDGDRPLAEEKQLRILQAAQQAEVSPAALKYACDLNGYFGGLPRLPHLPLTAHQRTALEQAMHPLRN